VEQGSQEWHRRFQTLQAGERPAAILGELAEETTPELVWRNELGGQTWRLGDRYLKWSPDAAGRDLLREVVRLRWLQGRHPVPRVLDAGHDGGGS
jgi:kanamycin kinase